MNSSSTATSAYETNRNQSLNERYQLVRDFSTELCKTLSAEDCMIQSMEDASPTRWHLAHTTWFFETFILSEWSNYRPFDQRFSYLFNSYYNSLGEQFPRPKRGVLSRPGLDEIKEYRAYVDQNLNDFLKNGDCKAELIPVIEIGLHHEQQHQELMLTDIKHAFSCNPLFPKFQEQVEFENSNRENSDAAWMKFGEGLFDFGFSGDGFCYDNESPQHRQFLEPFELRPTLVTNGEYLEFIESGGYEVPDWWLSAGWTTIKENSWNSPLYWVKKDDRWYEFTLAGLVPLDLNRPVCHVSYYEADAFARSVGYRLPTEFEWEHAAGSLQKYGQFVDELLMLQQPIHPTAGDTSLFGNVWQWTSSQYTAYPGYHAPEGAIGEYNGKFMCNQFVLRGGSCATHSSHIRPTYRNFFPPEARWQFSGIRLAK